VAFNLQKLCVDKNGKFVGSCAAVNAYAEVPSKPPAGDHRYWTWDFDKNEWIEDLDTAKNLAIQQLKKNYRAAITETDERYMQYEKRKALGISDTSDENDYQKALDLYKQKTFIYKDKKAQIEAAASVQEIINIDLSV